MTFCILCHDARQLHGGKCRRCLDDLARAHHRKADQCLRLASAFGLKALPVDELIRQADRLRWLAVGFEKAIA